MPASRQKNLYERYQPIRRRVEIGFWIVVMALQALFNTVVAMVDARRLDPAPATWQIVVWELSSHLVLLALIPALFAYERRFPLARLEQLGRHLAWHVAGSLVFSIVHVAAMVALRQLAYALAGERYDFGDWTGRWFYEYLKDVRTYAMLLAGLLSYRLFVLRLQGEARLLDPPEAAGDGDASLDASDAPDAAVAPAAAPRPERFLVRKLRREFLIGASDIEWLQAQGNYVGLHVNGHDYLLRATLTDFLAQLDPARFVRVHRSHAVNLDRIREIEPLDTGDARLHMHDGSVVPCSRRYRETLRNPV